MRNNSRAPALLFIVIVSIILLGFVPLAMAYTWSSDTKIVGHLAMDTYPAVLQTEDDNIRVFWQTNRNLYNNIPQNDIYYKTMFPNGTWTSDTRLTYHPNEDLTPSVTQVYNGSIWLVWASNRPIPPANTTGNKEIFYRVGTSSGDFSGSIDTQLTNDINDDWRPSIFQTQDLKIWVAWSSNRTGNTEIYFKTSSDNGATWTNDMQLTQNPSQDSAPAITQARDGTIWVAWQSNRTGNNEIFHKTAPATGDFSQSVETQLTNHVRFDTSPSVMQAGDRKIWIVWQSNRILNGGIPQNDIFYNTYDGSSWSGDTQLTFDMASDITPSIVQGHNDIWVVWASGRSDSLDIYYKTTNVPVHDVGVYRVLADSPLFPWPANRSYVGRSINISVQVRNWGTSSETFDVSASYNGTSLGTKAVSALGAGDSLKLNFTWNTAGALAGNYFFQATATQVAGETYTADNSLTGKPLYLKIQGDIKSDKKVDLFDAITLSTNFGCPAIKYPDCDINGDTSVNVLDAILVTSHWGETSP